MKEIVRFLKIKTHVLIIFSLYIVFLFASTLFGIDRNYILYIMLVSVLLFLVDIVISFINYKKISNALTYWADDPSMDPPDIINNTKFFEEIDSINKLNKEMEKSFDLKMKEFKDYMTMWAHQVKTPLFSLDLILNDHPVDSHAARAEVFEIEEYIESLLSY